MLSVQWKLVIAFCSIVAANSHAQTAIQPPYIPKPLQPYVDRRISLANWKSTIEFVARAKFEAHTYEVETNGVKTLQDHSLEGVCNSAAFKSFYRGMHLSMATYYLFLSKQEVGWFEYAMPLGGSPLKPNRHFLGVGRASLLSLWQRDRASDIVAALASFGALPPDLKADLKSFVVELVAHRSRVENLMARSADKVHDLIARESATYFYAYLLNRKHDKDGRDLTPDHEKGLTYNELSERLLVLFNQTRDPSEKAISNCLIGRAPFRLLIGDKQINSTPDLYPMKFMTSFWLRRQAEGTDRLAESVLVAISSILQ